MIRPAAAALLAVSLVACTSSAVGGAGKPGSSSPTATSPSSTAPTWHSDIGLTVTLYFQGEQMAITLLAIKNSTRETDGSRPRNGHRLYAVEFRIRNTGHKRLSEGPWISTSVVDQQGHQYDPAIVVSLAAGPEMPGTVDIGPGDYRVGWIAFDVPTSAHVRHIDYESNDDLGPAGASWSV